MQDLVASLASGGPSQNVPQVRINECLLALARAKVVVKAVVKVRPVSLPLLSSSLSGASSCGEEAGLLTVMGLLQGATTYRLDPNKCAV